MHEIEISHHAHRQVRRLPESTQERIDQAIAGLAENPRPVGSKKLTGMEGYRVRVGDYRILYQVDDKAKTVTIYRVMSRREAYRF